MTWLVSRKKKIERQQRGEKAELGPYLDVFDQACVVLRLGVCVYIEVA